MRANDARTGETLHHLFVAYLMFDDDRQNQGFASLGQIYVFPSPDVFCIMCFWYREKHYHIGCSVDNAEAALEGMRYLLSHEVCAERFASKLLREHWDDISEPERDNTYLQITPQQRSMAH